MFKLLKSFFTSKKRPEVIADKSISPDERVDKLLSDLRANLNQFLITRRVETGVIKKTSRWSLTKSHPGLFRLEAKGISLLINTAPFLMEKDGTIQGLLRMNEADICRAIHENEGAEAFVRRSEPLPGHNHFLRDKISDVDREPDREGESIELRQGIDDLCKWSKFDIDQMITKSSPNTLAHLLVHANPETVMIVKKHLSRRLKEIIILELEALHYSGLKPEINPHSRNRSLLDYEKALEEFQKIMQDYLRKEYIKKIRKQ